MPPSNPPSFNFTFSPSLEPWNLSVQDWLTQNAKHYHGLATAVVVFRQEHDSIAAEAQTETKDQVLLLQRAPHDSMPNKWELPGGAADETDATLLVAAARELWEESGLVAARFTHLVRVPLVASRQDGSARELSGGGGEEGHVFTNRTGQFIFFRFVFAAEVQSTARVTLDPDEHQDYVWATEEEVRAQQLTGGREIPITHPTVKEIVLEAFRMRKENGGSNL